MDASDASPTEGTLDIEKPQTRQSISDHKDGYEMHKIAKTQSKPPHDLEKSTTTHTLTGAHANALVVFVVLTQLVQMIPYGVGINSGIIISPLLGSTSQKGAWIAASYPLTQGATVLMGGTLGSVYGHKNILALGCVWWIFWTLATGMMDNLVGMGICRGLTGAGGGLMVPNAVALLGITFPPGRRRNFGMALFGAMAPVGAAGGSLVAGAFVQEVQWKWLFLFMALLGLVVFGAAIFLVPADEPMNPGGKIDWIGAYLGAAGLVFFNFAWNQAPFVGWDEPYEYVILIIGVLHLFAFVVWEAKFAESPILPFDIWKSPSFGVLMLVLFLAFMSIGIYIWYVWIFLHNIRGFSPVMGGVAFLPLTVLGTLAAILAGWLVPRLPAQVILGIGCTAAAVSNILLATTPRYQIYWAMIFPSMIVVAFTADLIFAAAQIIASNAVERKFQGAAGSLIGTLLTYGLSTGLGFAGTVEVYAGSGDELKGYRAAVWLAVGFAGAALVLNVLFVRVPKSNKEGW